MKLIIAIVQDKDSPKLSETLSKKGVRATKLASTGGFLKVGNTTFMIGIEDERVGEVVNIIRDTCKTREQMVSGGTYPSASNSFEVFPMSVNVGGATVFVIPIERFEHF